MKKRKDGRYCKNIEIGRRDDGSRIFKTVYGTSKAEVERKAAAVRADVCLGLDITADQSFAEWAGLFLASQQLHLSASEFRTKKARIEAFFPSVGSLSIRSIKPANIEGVLASLAVCNPRTGRPSSEKTLREYRIACGQVFKYAMKNQALAFNPCEFAEIPKSTPKKERRALSDSERSHLDILQGDCRLPALLACYAGLRRGELTALTWEDVNLKEGYIVINKSWDFKSKKLKTPKTKAGERVVPLVEKLRVELAAVKNKKGLVCTSKGRQISDGLWEALLVDMLTQIDAAFGVDAPPVRVGSKYERLITVQPFGWHDLRHTFCTLCYNSGMDVLSCKEIMGHSDVKTTMAIYTHLSAGKLKHSASALDAFIGA